MKQRKFFFGRWPYLDLWLDCWLLQVRTEMLNKSFMDFTVHWIRLDVKVCGGRWGFAFKLYSPDRESMIAYTKSLERRLAQIEAEQTVATILSVGEADAQFRAWFDQTDIALNAQRNPIYTDIARRAWLAAREVKIGRPS